jgi:hypothetical protein
MAMTFTAVLQRDPDMDGGFVVVPFDVQAAFGAKRIKVKATFDGVAYRGSIVRMEGAFVIGVTQAIRGQIGKQPGDTINVTVERDDEPRTVELPDTLRAALEADTEAAQAFQALSYTRRKEYAAWVAQAKTEATTQRRLEKMLAELHERKSL